MIEISEDSQNSLKDYTFIDLFAGIGGFRYALESFGSQCVFTSEWDKNAQKTYELNFNEKPEGDITKINEKSIPQHDILCAGFPCQAFSISGKQKGFDDTRGTLFFEVARIAKQHNPKLIFLENVKNFARHDNGNTLETIILTLKELGEYGYDVFYDVLNASNFGVPQSRHRIYILAFRKDLEVNNFLFPKSNGVKTMLKDFLQSDEEIEIDQYKINRKDIVMKDNIELKQDLYGNYPQKPIRIGTISKGGQGERIYHPNGHAITLSAYGGGVAGKTGCYNINNVNRKLTEKEVARVSGFPNTFKFHPSKSQTYQQFGNTVVINVLQEIMKKVIKDKIL